MTVDRIVLDTNILISAALSPDGAPRAVVETVRSSGGKLLFSRETYDELRTRFLRSKFHTYVSRESRALFLAQLGIISEWVLIEGAILGCRDLDDDTFLETALTGRADCLVTGDGDLLAMSPFRDVSILRPVEFLGSFRAGTLT